MTEASESKPRRRPLPHIFYMHMHVDYSEGLMRTTVEIADEHRARLVELVARRREKGFSRIASEAIEQYLEALDRAEADRRKALKLRGSLSPRQAERLETETAQIRNSWR